MQYSLLEYQSNVVNIVVLQLYIMHHRTVEREDKKSTQTIPNAFCSIHPVLSTHITGNPRCGQDYVYLHVPQNKERKTESLNFYPIHRVTIIIFRGSRFLNSEFGENTVYVVKGDTGFSSITGFELQANIILLFLLLFTFVHWMGYSRDLIHRLWIIEPLFSLSKKIWDKKCVKLSPERFS